MPEPFRTDDELVSAVLDGEATADERARVAADPALSARLAEFAAVADALSEPVTAPSAVTRDAAIASAVAEARRAEEVVVALKPRRSNGSFLAVAAAVLLVLLFAGFLVGQVGDRDSEDAASSSDDSGGEDSGPAEAAGQASDEEAAADDTAETDGAFAESPPVDLGEVADEAALRAALAASGALNEFDASPTTRSTLPAATPEGTAAVPGDSVECEVRLEESDPALDGRLLQGTATYAGTPAVVYVFATVDGDTRVQVVTADACQTLVAFPL